jgi:5-deoxy-D-glucuronate isomerase
MAIVNVISDLGGSFSYELRATGRSRVGLGRGRGSASGSTGAGIAWVLVEGGEGALAVGRETVHVGGRDDVFDEPGWSALIGPKTPLAVRGALRYTMIWRSWTEEAPTRIIPPNEVLDERHGEGPGAWSIRAYVPSGPLTCGETVAGPGAWSSWPPHRHDHEEVIMYRFDPAHGFGVQVLDTKEGDRRAEVVLDGQVSRIRGGHHPAVTSPAARMATVWGIAGERGTLEPALDPRSA